MRAQQKEIDRKRVSESTVEHTIEIEVSAIESAIPSNSQLEQKRQKRT